MDHGAGLMAPIIFTEAILNKKPIDIFNQGNMSRDFTYIDDVIESIIRLIDKPASKNKLFDKEESRPFDKLGALSNP